MAKHEREQNVTPSCVARFDSPCHVMHLSCLREMRMADVFEGFYRGIKY